MADPGMLEGLVKQRSRRMRLDGGEEPDEEEKLSLLCMICDEKYDEADKRPLVLMCGHTFCKNCLARFIQSKGYIQCMTCRRKFKDIYQNVSQIGINIEISRIVTQLKDNLPCQS